MFAITNSDAVLTCCTIDRKCPYNNSEFYMISWYIVYFWKIVFPSEYEKWMNYTWKRKDMYIAQCRLQTILFDFDRDAGEIRLLMKTPCAWHDNQLRIVSHAISFLSKNRAGWLQISRTNVGILISSAVVLWQRYRTLLISSTGETWYSVRRL